MIPLRDDNPTRLLPVVTYALIAACVLAFLWQSSLSARAQQVAVYALGMIPATLFDHARLPPEVALVPPSATLVTSMFLHGGWLHLLGNLLYLWIFGNNVEDAMGHGRFLVFYLVCGLAAALAQALPEPTSEVHMVGASGALSGVLGAYLLLYPHARVLVFIPVPPLMRLLELPAAWVLGFWLLVQLLSSVASGDQEGGVAFGAHIGGFIAGLVLVPLFRRRGVRLMQDRRR
jgi:membrane associated rhomboid family serine protease